MPIRRKKVQPIHLYILLAPLLVGLLLPWLNRLIPDTLHHFKWVIDLLVHWQWLFSLGAFFIVVLLIRRTKVYLIGLLLIPLPFFSASTPLDSTKANKQGLKIASANIYFESNSTAQLHSWLEQEKPDVVLLLELAPHHAAQIKQWQDYPYQHLAPDYSPFGLGIISRLPLKNIEVIELPNYTPYIKAQSQYQNKTVQFIAYHPMPPITADYLQLRDQSIKNLVIDSQNTKLPTLIIGDFNSTPWSSSFHDLQKLGWRRVMSLVPTWPTWGHKLIGIPIDQIVVSPDWQHISNKVGGSISSDHFPIVAEVRLQ